MYVSLRQDYEVNQCAVYVIPVYDLQGGKEILWLWLSSTESKNQWMQIFDELKNSDVEDVFFISVDGVSGLEAGAKSIFPDVVAQRCIVHLIRNSIKYILSKEYKKYTQSIKRVYDGPSLKAAQSAYDSFVNEWNKYPGAIYLWKRNFIYIEQLFNYGSVVRKIMYTTNAIESVNSSLRKVTKKERFQMKMYYSNCSI